MTQKWSKIVKNCYNHDLKKLNYKIRHPEQFFMSKYKCCIPTVFFRFQLFKGWCPKHSLAEMANPYPNFWRKVRVTQCFWCRKTLGWLWTKTKWWNRKCWRSSYLGDWSRPNFQRTSCSADRKWVSESLIQINIENCEFRFFDTTKSRYSNVNETFPNASLLLGERFYKVSSKSTVQLFRIWLF